MEKKIGKVNSIQFLLRGFVRYCHNLPMSCLESSRQIFWRLSGLLVAGFQFVKMTGEVLGLEIVTPSRFKDMVITVHKTDSSPPARAVLMAVELLSLEVELINVNFQTKEHITPEYLKKNPIHTVPLLEDEDFVIADSHVIITYLVSKYGTALHATLYPSELKERAITDHRLYLDGTILFPRLLAIVKSVLNDKAPGPNAKQLEEVMEAYGFVEKFLEQTRFLAGDHITLADISAVSTVSSLDALVPIESEKFPKIIEWWNKLKAESWYQKVNVPGLTQFESHLKSTMEQNTKNS